MKTNAAPTSPAGATFGPFTPPHNAEAEQAVLGSILMNPDLLGDLTGQLTTDDFYRGEHQDIFEALTRLADQSVPTDETAVIVELERSGLLEKLPGGPAYIAVLAERAAPANAVYYAGILREERLKRGLLQYHTKGLQQVREGGLKAEDLVSHAQSGLDDVSDQRTSSGALTPLTEALVATMDRMEDLRRQSESPAGMTGIPTGIAGLDEILQGLHPGQMIVVGARPSVGKTSLGTDLARSAAIAHRIPTAFFSLEMSVEEVTMRLISAEARIPLAAVRSGHLDDEQWQRLSRKQADLHEAPLVIDETANITMAEIKAKCRLLQQRHGLKLVVIDYLQLMTSDRRANNRQEEVSAISRACKLLAKELGVAVVVLAQLNRKSEERVDKRPQVSDLRESGAVEQDADVILLLYREDLVDPDSARVGEADIIIGKHRNGRVGIVPAVFLAHLASFRSAA